MKLFSDFSNVFAVHVRDFVELLLLQLHGVISSWLCVLEYRCILLCSGLLIMLHFEHNLEVGSDGGVNATFQSFVLPFPVVFVDRKFLNSVASVRGKNHQIIVLRCSTRDREVVVTPNKSELFRNHGVD